MIAAVLLAAALASTALAQSPLAPGDPLPELRGDYLTKRKAVLPADAKGKAALLLLGFSYDSRFPVEKMSKEFAAKTKGMPNLTWYEIPMIGGMGRIASIFIDSGMRKGTPKELHENVITVYGGVDPWKKRCAMTSDKEAHLILIDKDGVVRWVHKSADSDSAVAKALEAVRQLPQ